jgi:hypothetical protein
MGSKVEKSDDLTLTVDLPLRAKIKLIRDGQVDIVHRGRRLEFNPTQTGSYRVEISRRGRSWIFSNAIRVAEV